jgi:hypothetical protein
MTIHAFIVVSNHAHFRVSPSSAQQLARLVHFVNASVAKEVAQTLGFISWHDHDFVLKNPMGVSLGGVPIVHHFITPGLSYPILSLLSPFLPV